MKFEDDDLKDGKLWAALQKEIDRDLAEKESGETFQEELADIEDSIEFESKETKSEDHRLHFGLLHFLLRFFVFCTLSCLKDTSQIT